jgi:hypothetical protein
MARKEQTLICTGFDTITQLPPVFTWQINRQTMDA